MKGLMIAGLAAFQSACTTIVTHTYGAVVDTRSVKEQARDTKAALAIRKAYLDDKDMKVLAVTPYVFLGKAYVVGAYENQTQKSKAVSLAKAVENVDSVTPFLTAKAAGGDCGSAQGLEMRAKVKAKLIGDKGIHSTNVEVDSTYCTIVLIGLVASQGEIDKSIEDAKSIQGVGKVKSFLEVHTAQ